MEIKTIPVLNCSSLTQNSQEVMTSLTFKMVSRSAMDLVVLETTSSSVVSLQRSKICMVAMEMTRSGSSTKSKEAWRQMELMLQKLMVSMETT